MPLLASEQQSGGFVVDAAGRTVVAIDQTDIPGGLAVTSTQTVANALAGNAGTFTAGATAALVPANATRKGLQVTVDTAATATVYFLLGAGSASATNFHFSMTAGGSWDGRVSGVLWTGAVQFFSSGTPKVGVGEV